MKTVKAKKSLVAIRFIFICLISFLDFVAFASETTEPFEGTKVVISIDQELFR